MARIEIEVESNAQEYWIAVDDQDVRIDNGFGSIAIPSGKHILYWGMRGVAGNTVSIKITHGDPAIPLAQVSDDPIPDGWNRGAGYVKFSV